MTMGRVHNSIAVCPYCRRSLKISYLTGDGDLDPTQILACPNDDCKQKFDAFSWITMADTLAGQRLPRPRDVQVGHRAGP
ncbi:MAG: hypothetical protein ACYDBQ_11725 [Thermoplasmatota archaeon]